MKASLQLSALAAAVAAALLASAPAHAITNVEANAGPQFNFVNPGARSLGMAGAFIGLADDSTAAYSNPAGLAQLSRREFAIEGRYTNYSTFSVERGRLIGEPTGIGLDTISGLDTQETDQSVANLSFLSFAFPLEHGTLAVYRHELANYEGGFSSDGAFTQTFDTTIQPPNVGRVAPSINDIDLQIVTYGFAGSWRLGSKFMLGASVNWYQFDFDTTTRRYNLDADGDGTPSRTERLTVVDFSPDQLRDVLSQNGDDSDFGYNIGLLWQPNDKFSLGAVYRKGPEFDYDYDWQRVGTPGVVYGGTTDFVVPDVIGLGMGFRPSDSWRISLDLAHVTYSDHVDNVVAQAFNGDIEYLNLNDSTEVRLGAEYTNIEAARPYSIRFGVWHEPDHQMYHDGELYQFTPGNPLTNLQNESNSHAAMFVRAEDSWHVTGGYGVVFDKFQLDAAIDLSDRADTLSLSLVYFFN